MKKIILDEIAALCAFTTGSAQERGRNRDWEAERSRAAASQQQVAGPEHWKQGPERERWAVGPRIGIYTHAGGDGAIFGLGAYGRYNISNHWRVEPGITALLKDGCSIDINADIQYPFPVARRWNVYPQVGISGNDLYGWSFGFDVGAGTDFILTRRWDLSAGVRWLIQTAKHHDNPIVINIGATYKF